MRKCTWMSLLALPLVVGGLVYAHSQTKSEEPQSANAAGYVCPITGEELPCPNCCPLNQSKANLRVKSEKQQSVNAAGYVGPITGEELPCPHCCPLNQSK